MPAEIPLRFVAKDEFATLRSFLEASGYSEAFLLEHFGAVSLHDLLGASGARRQAFDDRYRGEGLPLFLARLFFGGKQATGAELDRYVPAGVQTTLRGTGLLDDAMRCPVLLHPAFGFCIASDRTDYAGADFVMSGAEGLCRQFVRYIGKEPCGRFLDMGTGAGIAALVASSFAREVWAVDIVERAVRYAEWNCGLNLAENIHVRQGDLFEPVRGMRFDRIVCNPPFEPSLTGDVVFSCGGEDGEAILARLIAETPQYLAPAGRLYCQVEGTDREAETLDRRVVRWLGEAGAEHDSALFVRDRYEPMQFAIRQTVLSNHDSAAVEQWAELYGRLGARAVLIGHLIVERHEGTRRSFHLRGQYDPEASIRDLEGCFDRQVAVAGGEFREFRPVLQGGWELHVRHKPVQGDMHPERYTFVTRAPLPEEWDVSPWMARMVTRCDGAITMEQHARWAETNAGVGAEEFAGGMRLLTWAGVLAPSRGEEQW
ncbi:MAG: methyltransferase [Bryobacterales bacterium]|nr:methyltransferase [Bryobacterales bacterium]